MGNSFKNRGLEITEAEQVIYTVPENTETVIHSLFIANVAEGHKGFVTITINDYSEVKDYPILYRAPVNPGSTLTFDKPINLETGDSLKISGSSNDTLTAFLSILEID
jgi:hypothetical protein